MCATLFFNYTWIVSSENHNTTISVVGKSPASARDTIAADIIESQQIHELIEIRSSHHHNFRKSVEGLETDLRRKLQILAELVSVDFTDETLSKNIDALLVATEPTAKLADEPRCSQDRKPKIFFL